MFNVNDENTFEAVVIGGGPGGYVAAIWLAKAGVRTCIVEGHKFGGTCLNYGCIPTKALYHYAKTIHTIHKHQDIGISTGEVLLDLEKVMAQKSETVNALVSGVETLINKNNITHKNGFASFLDDHHLNIINSDGVSEVIKGNHIIVATGSEPILPPIKGLSEGIDQNLVITSKEALSLSEIPKELAIIGGGVIGMEFATIYNQFGSNVTVIEATDSLLPSFNKELVKRYKPLVKKQGIKALTGAMVSEVVLLDDGSVKVVYDTKKGEQEIICDKVICAVGRKPRFKDLGLDKLSEEIEDGRKVVVNDFMETTINHIYGIGDVNGLSLLAHSASKQGLIAATQIINELSLSNELIKPLPKPSGFSTYTIPQVAFLLPELSQASLNEVSQEATLSMGKFSYRSNGMALAIAEKDGLCKVEYDESKARLTYMGILGETGSELIQIGAHMIDHELNFDQLTDGVVGHPSLSEILHEALLDIHKMGIHQL